MIPSSVQVTLSNKQHRNSTRKPWWTDDDACLEYLFSERFKEVTCVHCGRRDGYYRHRTKPCYTCACGRSHLYPMKGTVFERTRLPLSKWFYTIWLLSKASGRFTAADVARSIDVTYPTAWRMLKKLRARQPKQGKFPFERLLRNYLQKPEIGTRHSS